MSEPFFSVVIPVLNRKELLARTLDSVLEQRFTDFEILVVDNGSTDGTPQMVRERYGDRVRLLHEMVRGIGPPRNRAMKRARGKYIAFLDSDDLFLPWTLEVYHRVLSENDGINFLVGDSVDFEKEASLPDLAKESVARFRSFMDYLSASVDVPYVRSPSAVAISREIVRRGIEFHAMHRNGEDNDFWLRIGEVPGYAKIDAPVTFAYRVHEQNFGLGAGRTYTGILALTSREKAAGYPGGPTRARERRRYITRFARPASFALARGGYPWQSWIIYLETFRWHVALGRWRYLAGFPLLLFGRLIKKGL